MSRALPAWVPRRDSVAVPKIGVALALSVLVHALALWQWMPQLNRPSDDTVLREKTGPLIVRLAPPPRPPRARPARRATPPRPAVRLPAPAPAPKAVPRPRPPVLALEKPAAQSAPKAPAAPSAPPPSAADLMAYVEAQRRSRGIAPPAAPAPAPAPPRPAVAEDANARANRIAAANLGLDRAPVFGERKRGGGIFEIQRMGYDSAEFLFFGWNREIRRNTSQVIEVRKGGNSDIRMAVVRRMIEIIRDHEKADFIWESPRLGRNVTLSARQRDTAGLEDFLMQEFFDEGLAPARR